MIDPQRYGPWALVAGASEGIGAAFARALSAAGLSVVLVARRPEPLDALAAEIGEARTIAADLGTPAGLAEIREGTRDLDIGLVVVNAAHAPIGRFLDRDAADALRAVEVNCAAPVSLAHHFLPPMVARGRGGLVLMSSIAGQQGSPGISAYAATKAFGAILAEGLWAEMRPHGVDVLACVAGAVSTPNLAAAKSKRAPGTVTPERVVATALGALGRRPRAVPGGLMKFSAVLTGRLLPKRAAIALIERASGDLSA